MSAVGGSLIDDMSALSDALLMHIPDGTAPNVENRLVGIHMSPTNKRNITIYVQTHGSNVLEVKYGLPVAPMASRIFLPSQEPHRIPSTHTLFLDHSVRRGYNHIQELRITDPLWDEEVDRLTQAQFDYPVGSHARKTIANILQYWRTMKRHIMLALANGGIDIRGQQVFERFSPSSSNRSASRRRRSSSQARRRSSQGTTPRQSSSQTRRRNRA
jgi:hypothetical protein